jgi:hypothetical protein
LISPWTQENGPGSQDGARALGADNPPELREKVQTVDTQEEEVCFERRGNIRHSKALLLI